MSFIKQFYFSFEIILVSSNQLSCSAHQTTNMNLESHKFSAVETFFPQKWVCLFIKYWVLKCKVVILYKKSVMWPAAGSGKIWMFCFFSAHSLCRCRENSNHRSLTLVMWHIRLTLCTLKKMFQQLKVEKIRVWWNWWHRWAKLP